MLAVLMVLSLIMMAIPARAISESDIEAIQQKRLHLEQELEEQAALIQSLNDNHALIIVRKAALDRQIALNRESIALMEEQISVYDQMIEEKVEELSEAIRQEDSQTELLRGRLRAMEEGGNYSYYTFLFASSSFSDLLSRIGDVSDIMHYDKDLEEAFRQTRQDVERLKGEYEQVNLEQSAIRDELDEKKQQLNAQIEAACGLIAELESRSDDAEEEFRAIEEAEYMAYLEEQQALAEYAAQLAAAQQNTWTYYYGGYDGTGGSSGGSGSGSGYSSGYVYGGSFIWPVDSTYVTSNFGYRNAPTAGASTYHQAIDIGAAGGSPIYAAADGQVAVATYNNGLGNYVSIAHDGETSTRYSHMTNFIVQPGEYVTQGQIIGYVGATGIATGNHLDFAVIQDGQSVDPLQFYDTSALTFDPTA